MPLPKLVFQRVAGPAAAVQLKPVKRRGNRRYYQRQDVLIIRQIRSLLYEEGFERFALGRAAAIGVVITIIIATLSFIQFRFFRREV